MDVFTEFAWIGWIVLILIFVIVEILTVDLIFLMLAIGSLGGLVSGAFGIPWWAQLLVAAVIALLLLFALRPPLLRMLKRGGDPAKSNVDALIGMHGHVVSSVTPTTGLVKLDVGETWTARVPRGVTSLEPGETVVVHAIDGATAIVGPLPVPPLQTPAPAPAPAPGAGELRARSSAWRRRAVNLQFVTAQTVHVKGTVQ